MSAPGGFYALGAGVKVAVTLVFIVTVVSFPAGAVLALCPYAAYPVGVAAWSGISLRRLGRQLLATSPLALAVAAAEPLMDTHPAVAFAGLEVSAGWLSFFSIVLRFLLTASALALLVWTTPIARIGAGLGAAGVPRVLVAQLSLTARYLGVVREEAAQLLRARALRAQGRRGLGLRSAGSMVVSLFLRSLGRAERVHRAMLARGFRGEVRVLGERGWSLADVTFLATATILCVVFRAVPLWAG